MGMRDLEQRILAEAKIVTGNKKLRMKDIMEWSSGDIDHRPEEKQYHLPNMGVNIAIKA